MKSLLRFEELGFFAFSIYLFEALPFAWWWFPLLLLVPDISIAAYVAGPRVGALVYNFIHHRALALACYAAGVMFAAPVVSLAGVILFAHSSLDRAFGYGLKFSDDFTNTHLGRIGHHAAESS